MKVSPTTRTFLDLAFNFSFIAAASLIVSEPALAGPVKDGLCGAIAVTESILPAVISVAAVGGASWALYMKQGGEWVQNAMKGVLGAGLLASTATIGGYVAGAKAKALFNCAGGAGAMQQIINNL
ncbi:MAG: hypothetical protein PHD37_06710 [Gallionellaceae bacterium]|nr:hypothetical protein [Gallionellaceae bacterium]